MGFSTLSTYHKKVNMKFVAASLVAFNAVSVSAFAPTGNPLTFKTNTRVSTTEPLNAIFKDALGKSEFKLKIK